MANEYTKITELPEGATLATDDLLVYVDNSGTPTTKKITEANAAAFLGTSGYSGYSGRSGYSGFSGTGVSGYSGFSGSGYSGYSGAGTSGFSGYSGLDGIASASGYSGYSGPSGYSGFTGKSGYSGFSAVSGYSGFSGSGGSSTFVGGQFETYKIIGVNSNPGLTTTAVIGVTAIAPGADASSSADDDDGVFIKRDTAATTTTQAGFDWNLGSLVKVAYLPQIFTKMKTGASLAACRIWIGVFSTTPSASDPAISGLGFRFDTVAGDTSWQAWSNDGSGGGTITDTGVTASTSTLYSFAIKVVNASSVEFYISTDNGVTYNLEATHATNLPAASTQMNYNFWIYTLENVAKSILHSWTYIRQR